MARIAFYAPLKPPNHPVPSGDRRLARLFIDALGRAGHDVRVASELRSYDGTGDPIRQSAIAAAGATEAAALVERYAADDWRPDLWFTYHLFHKAPDHIGPPVSAALGIPYVVAEASYAPKRAEGPWDRGHRAVRAALGAADHVIFLNPVDRGCVEPLLRPGTGTTDLLPFIDTAPFAAAARDRAAHRQALVDDLELNDRSAILLSVAMMRAGDKLASYRLLAEALAEVPEADWALVVVGDGPARSDVENAFAARSDRVRFLGDRSVRELPDIYAGADLCVWPAIGEAIGMAVLEAICTGTPAVVGMAGSLGKIVLNGHSGKLTPLGDRSKFARAVAELVADPERRRALAAGALAQAPRHDIAVAAGVLDAVVDRLTGERP